MVSLINVSTAQKQLAIECQKQRVSAGFTQLGLSERAGVPLPTLRKFEQKGLISLESFLKIAMTLGLLERLVNAVKLDAIPFSSMDELLQADKKSVRKRGWRT